MPPLLKTAPPSCWLASDASPPVSVSDSIVTDNYGESFWTSPYHDLFVIAKRLSITGSTVD